MHQDGVLEGDLIAAVAEFALRVLAASATG